MDLTVVIYPLGLKFIPIYKNQHKNIIDYIIDATNYFNTELMRR